MTIQGENSVIFAGWREDGHKARRAEFIKHPQELGGSLILGWPRSSGITGRAQGCPSSSWGTQTQHLTLSLPLNHFPEHELPDTHLFLDFSHQAGAGNGFFQCGGVGLPCSGTAAASLSAAHSTFISLFLFYFPPFIFFFHPTYGYKQK